MSNKEKLEKLIATVLSDGTTAEDLAKHLDKNNVIVLPCAIGSTVWAISKNCAEPFPTKFRLDDLAQMGRRVFLSRAEALRHMGRGARR